MQTCCHFNSPDQGNIILSLNCILDLWNKTNSPKNLHQHQLNTPEEDHQQTILLAQSS